MKAVFPGKPQPKLHAFSTVLWHGQRILTYISQNALIVLRGPNDLIQTTVHGDNDVLEAVAICEATGKIATCTKSTVFIYSPFGQDVGALKWSLHHTLTPACNDRSLATVSWGLPDEVLAAGSSLTLIVVDKHARETWSRELANPAKLAAFSPDASFMATTGNYDRLVKIWSRQYLGGEEEEERFDVSYLAHPAAVTSLRWHSRPDSEHHSDVVLYTTCGDSKLRIWAGTDHHALQPLQLWTELDLNDCILPRNPLSPSVVSPRYMFVIDAWEFDSMVEDSIQKSAGGEREKHTREHLSDVAYRNPDVCVVMDDKGNMSAWGLERVGCKARQPNDIFNIVLAEALNINIPDSSTTHEGYITFLNFAGIKDGTLNVVANLFNGSIDWLSSPVDRFFDTSSSFRRFQAEATWTGPAEPIESLLWSAKNRCFLSMSHQQEIVAWELGGEDTKSIISRQSVFRTDEEKSCGCFLFDDRYVALASSSKIELWDLKRSVAHKVASHSLQANFDPTCLIPLPETTYDSDIEFFMLITKEMRGIVWRVSRDRITDLVSMEIFAEIDTPKGFEDTKFRQIRPESVSTRSRPIMYSVAASGTLTTWGADLNIEERTAKMKCRSTTETGLSEPALTCIGAFGKAAVVSSSRSAITVWDLRLGHLELQKTFETHEIIHAIDIVSSSSEGSFLSIAFAHRALMYVQDRYGADPSEAAWTLLQTVDIGETNNVPIADCMWLPSHDLLLAAGNQMFLFENQVTVPQDVFSSIEVSPKLNSTAALPAVAAALNSASAIFHPDLLLQILFSGDIERADRLFNSIHNKLKYWTQGDELGSWLGVEPVDYLEMAAPQLSISWDDSTSEHGGLEEDTNARFSEDASTSLKETLEKNDLPYVSTGQQGRLASLGESLGAFEKHRASVDKLAIIYLIRLHLLIKQPPTVRSPMPWSDIAWASHSNSQDAMVDLTSRMYQGRMLWKDAKESGLCMWLSDIEALRAQFEVIGRNEYTKTDERNPIDCSLYYLALKKKPVLVGLWRMATWNREQAATQRLLANNFADPRWQTAAMKNAYALLGLRRFEYAAAFFLLADRPKDAVSVLVSQLGDMELAIAVARVYGGDDGPVLKELLREKVLPRAAREGNKWLASWGFWLLNQSDMALRALAEPLHDLISLSEPPTLQSKHYSNSEPALVHLYRHLRDELHRDPRGKRTTVSPKSEWDLVMRSAMSYVRGGCHLLALDLVRNWEFRHKAPPTHVNGVNAEPTSDDIITKDQPTKVDSEMERLRIDSPTKPQRKKVTEEPNTASILDNFDF